MRAQWRMQSRMPWRMQWRAHAEGRMHGRASGNITAGETVNTTGRRARVASVHTSKIILPRPRFLSRPAPVAAERGRPGHGDYGSALTRARDPIAGSRWFGASGPSKARVGRRSTHGSRPLKPYYMIYRPLYAISSWPTPRLRTGLPVPGGVSARSGRAVSGNFSVRAKRRQAPRGLATARNPLANLRR
jgi:hypothetical protein